VTWYFDLDTSQVAQKEERGYRERVSQGPRFQVSRQTAHYGPAAFEAWAQLLMIILTVVCCWPWPIGPVVVVLCILRVVCCWPGPSGQLLTWFGPMHLTRPVAHVGLALVAPRPWAGRCRAQSSSVWQQHNSTPAHQHRRSVAPLWGWGPRWPPRPWAGRCRAQSSSAWHATILTQTMTQIAQQPTAAHADTAHQQHSSIHAPQQPHIHRISDRGT
jgi:hypothetical protein